MAPHLSPGEQEWQAAQGIKISLNVIDPAKIQMAFLSEVERYPCLYWNDEAISRAIKRYSTYWLPLAAEEEGVLIPPLDCAWIWHCHRLTPNQYARDCEAGFGKIIGASIFLSPEQQWERRYSDEPYSLDLSAYGNCRPGSVVQQPGGMALSDPILETRNRQALSPKVATAWLIQ